MNVAIVKAGGSGNVLETDSKHAIPWLAYRRFKFDPSYLHQLVDGVLSVVETHKIVFVPGGMGAYLYIELAREFGLPDSVLAEIGCEIVNVNGRIVIEAMSSRGLLVCPDLVGVEPSAAELLGKYDVMVMAARPEYLSTDALAAVTAASIPGSELVIFKKGVPVYHVGFDKPTVVEKFTVEELRSIATGFDERPGANSILDGHCLDVIEKGAVRTRLVNSEHLGELKRVLGADADASLRQTLIGG